MEINRLEIIQSYIAVRNLLGLTNSDKNQIVSLAFEETAKELFVKNGLTQRKLILLNRTMTKGSEWEVATTYGQAEPLAEYLGKQLKKQRLQRPTEICMEATESLFDYKS